jgi:hypothetical protein
MDISCLAAGVLFLLWDLTRDVWRLYNAKKKNTRERVNSVPMDSVKVSLFYNIFLCIYIITIGGTKGCS